MTVFAEYLLPVDAYPLGAMVTDAVAVEVERVVPTAGSTHYVWVTGPNHDEFLTALDGDGVVADATTVDALGDRVLLRLQWDERPAVLEWLAEFDARLDRLVGTAEGWSLAARFPNSADVSAFTSVCREHGLEVEERGFSVADPSGHPDALALTDAQARTLAVAYEHGYFEIPRAITLADLAEDLGVSEQAISERIRRGLFALLMAYWQTE